MNIQSEKLKLIRALLDTENEDVLKRVRGVFRKHSKRDETEYLLSTKANRENLMTSIKESKAGRGIAIKTADLWK